MIEPGTILLPFCVFFTITFIGPIRNVILGSLRRLCGSNKYKELKE
jgi:ABC-type uncharacterized transport system permease subunit